MDLTRQRLKVVLRLNFRLAVIVVAAAVTAQPVELMAFQPAIENRSHQEELTTFAVVLLEKLDNIEEERKSLPPPDRAQIESCKDLRQFREELLLQEQMKSEVDGLENHRKDLGNQIARLRRDTVSTSEERTRKEQAIARIQARRQSVSNRLDSKRAELARQMIKVKVIRDTNPGLAAKCDADYQQAVERHQGRLTGLGELQDSIKKHLGELRRRDPRSAEAYPALEIGSEKYQYEFIGYDVWNQLRVLGDLVAGRPAKWAGSHRPLLMERAETLGLTTPRDCDVGDPPCDDEAKLAWRKVKPELILDGERYSLWSRFILIVAVLVPCLAIAIKLFASVDLVHYYSLRSQIIEGNLDALKVGQLEGEGTP